MFDELRENEFNDLLKLGWLEEGTDADKGKFKLSAKGVKEYGRVIESLSAKSQVIIELMKNGNAFTNESVVKNYMN